jgi:hypothetical protein
MQVGVVVCGSVVLVSGLFPAPLPVSDERVPNCELPAYIAAQAEAIALPLA